MGAGEGAPVAAGSGAMEAFQPGSPLLDGEAAEWVDTDQRISLSRESSSNGSAGQHPAADSSSDDATSISISSAGATRGTFAQELVDQRFVDLNEPEIIAAMLPRLKGITFQQGLITSLNYNLGFSVLVFPFNLARSGWVGIATLLGASLVTWLTASFIADIMLENPTVRTYSDMGRKAASLLSNNSRRAERGTLLFFRTFQMLELFMYLLFSIISIEDALLALKPDLSPKVALAITTGFVFLMIPSTLSGKILARVGTFGVLSFAGCLTLLIVSSILELTEVGTTHVDEMPFISKELKRFFGGYGGILLLFAGHAIYPSIFNDLEDKKDMMRVVNWTYSCMVLGSLTLAFLVVFGYGPSQIVELPTGHLEDGSAVNIAGQVLIICKMVFAYGPISYPIVNEVAMLIKGTTFRRWSNNKHPKPEPVVLPDSPPPVLFPERNAASPRLRLLIGAVLACAAITVAKIMPSLSFVVSITGALFAVSLSLTLPSIVFLITMPVDRFRLKRYIAFALLVFGITSSCLAFYAIF